MEQQKQKAYIKDSFTRAIRKVNVEKIEDRKLLSVDDDFINEMMGVWYYESLYIYLLL